MVVFTALVWLAYAGPAAAEGPGEWERVFGGPAPVRLFALEMNSATSGWAAGDEGRIFQYADGQWRAVLSPTSYRIYDIAMTDVNNGWAVGDYGTVLRFTDGQWHRWPQQLFNINLHALTMTRVGPDGSEEGWAVGRAGTILRYAEGQWATVPSPTPFALYDVVEVSPTLAFAVGGGGTILRYDGWVWLQEDSPTQVALNALSFSAVDDGWAVGNGGAILHYNGHSWQAIAGPTPAQYYMDVLALGLNEVWVAGETGTLWHYDGANWHSAVVDVPATGNQIPNSLYVLAEEDGTVWAAGFGGTILRADDGVWREDGRLTSLAWNALVWRDDRAWGVGEAGTLFTYNEGRWSAFAGPTTVTLHAVTLDTTGALWAAGDEGTLLTSSDGAAWITVTSPTTAPLYGLTFPDLTTGWAVGGTALGQILRYDGSNWDVITTTSATLYAVDFVSTADGWAVGAHGGIWHYTRMEWTEMPAPVSTALWSVDALSPDDAWAVGEAGCIVHYDGTVWDAVASPTEKGLHKVIMLNAQEGWAFGDSGTLLHYDGVRWDNVTSPTSYRLLSETLDGQGVLWAVGHGGTLLRRSPTDGTFRLTLSPAQEFMIPGASVRITPTLSFFDDHHGPVTVTLEGDPVVLTVNWTMQVVSKSTALPVQLTVAASAVRATVPLTITASDGIYTHSTTLALALLPGAWASGPAMYPAGLIHDMAGDGAGSIWAVGGNGMLARYRPGQWEQFEASIAGDLYAVTALSSTLAWAAGEAGTLLRFDGMDWIVETTPITAPIYGMAFASPVDGWAVGGAGEIIHYDGASWQAVATPGQDWLYDIALADDGTGWAVGWGGAIWRFDGMTWSATDSPTHQWLRAVHVVSSEEAWAVGSEGAILHYIGGGWQLYPSLVVARLFDVIFTAPDLGWVVGGDGTLLHYDGDTWRVLPRIAEGDLRALAIGSPTYALAAGIHGEMLCYGAVQNGSVQWSECGETFVIWKDARPYRLFLPLVGNQSLLKESFEGFGVQTMGGTFSRDPAIVAQMAAAGIRRARMPFSWKLIEPENMTVEQFHWSVYDDWFELLALAGIHPMPFLARNPAWAGDLPAAALNQSDVNEQTTFVEAAVHRYSQPPYGVTHWEVYNEPDNHEQLLAETGWGQWGDDGAGYVAQLERIHMAVKAVNPAAQVVLGGIAYDYFVEDGGPFVRTFITDVLQFGGGQYFDVLNFHYYGSDFTGQIRFFQNLLVDYGLSKPIVCTEVGTAVGVPTLEAEGEAYARYAPQVMVRGIANGLQAVNWFALSDMESGWRPGLFGLDRRPRPVFEIYRTLTTLLRGAYYERPLLVVEMQSLPLEGYRFVTPRGWLYVVWTSSDVIVDWRVAAPQVLLTNKWGVSRYVYDGDDGVVDGVTTFPVGVNPLYVEIER
ncbi:MAG: YCF48-related protein [Anaerolineae bacterium]